MTTKTALFTNFTIEEFTGWWDGKAKKFAPGESKYMPDYLARHYAKHLTNRELLRTDKHGNLIHKGGEKFTSPKNPGDTLMFMELFNKAYTPTEEEILEGAKDDIDSIIESTNKNKGKVKPKSEKTKAEEDEFKGKPKEPSNLI